MANKRPMQLLQPTVHQLDKPSEPITYDSVLGDSLKGVALAVERLTDIVRNDESENKDKIAAAKGLLDIMMRMAEVKVVEELPLLKKLEAELRN